MPTPASDSNLPVDPDHDHEHVDDDAENTAPVDSDVTDELAENPVPTKKDEPAAPAPAPAPAGDDVAPKRPRGRPRKETAATPAKKDAPGADVAPKADRAAQVTDILQLKASAIGDMVMMLAGWPRLTAEECAVIDKEFEAREIPPEWKKAAIVAMVVWPRASQDNRIRKALGVGQVDGGDEPQRQRDELARQRAELEAQRAQAQAAPAPAPAPQIKPVPTVAARPQADKPKSYL